MLVLAHPLQTHRLAHRLRDQRRLRRAVVGAVAAIAARAFDVDAAHVLGLQLQHGGELQPQQVARLRRRPHRQLALLEVSHRARRADRSVRVHRQLIGRLQGLAGALQRLGRVPAGLEHLAAVDLRVAHVLEELTLFGQPGPVRPLGDDGHRGADRGPFVARDHGQEVALAHRAQVAGDLATWGVAEAQQLRLDARRMHHARVQHARQLDVVHEVECAEDLGRNVEPGHGGADDGVVLRDPSAARPGFSFIVSWRPPTSSAYDSERLPSRAAMPPSRATSSALATPSRPRPGRARPRARSPPRAGSACRRSGSTGWHRSAPGPGVSCVSPWIVVTRANGTDSSSAAICVMPSARRCRARPCRSTASPAPGRRWR